MAWKNSKVLRFIPDQIGRGGSKTSLSTQSINLDLRLAQNVFVNYGRWRRAGNPFLASDFPAIGASAESYALHNFAKFDTTNAALGPINRLLSHNRLVTGQQQINQHNPFAVVKDYTPPGALDTVPATFLNITNRCFICWGATNNFIYTGTETYDVGVDAPATAATYTFGGVGSGVLAASAGGFVVTTQTGLETVGAFNNNVKFITIGGVQYPTRQPNPYSNGPFTIGGNLTGTGGSAAIVINAFHFPDRDYTGLIINFTDDLAVAESHYILNYQIVGANTNVNLDTPLTNNATNVGYTLTGEQLTLGSAYTGETTTSVSFTTFDGPLRWTDTPPKYAYSYYDSPFLDEGGTASGTIATNTITITGDEWGAKRYVGVTITVLGNSYTVQSYATGGGDTTVTTTAPLVAGIPALSAYTLTGTLAAYGTGHISNASPATIVTEQDQGGVSVVLNNIMPSRVEDQERFNKIQIFKQISGSFSPLDHSLNLLNNVGTAPLSFTDTFMPDQYLVSSVFEFPFKKNRKPPPFAHQAFWDGRVWGNPVDRPYAIVFSADLVQVTFGVPSECYPSSNELNISSDDGRVTGIGLMGPLIIITTERYAYYVTGTDENSYRLARFSTLMMGVGDKQMIEFAGATTDDSDLLLYVGKDKRFYLTAPSVGNVSISDPIQDFFNRGIAAYGLIRVANVALNGNHFLVVNVSQSAPGFGYTAATYDWDRKIWTNHAMGPGTPQGFAILYGDDPPVRFLFIVNGAVYEWLGVNNTQGVANALIQTMPLGGDRKSRYRIHAVRAYVSNPIPRWTFRVGVDERPINSTAYLAALYTDPGFDPLDTMQPPASFPIDDPNAREIIVTDAMMQEQGGILDGHRFQIEIDWPPGTGMEEVYAFDVLVEDLGRPDETSM